MKKWIFDPKEHSAILEEGTEEIVAYINDVHPEVIVKLVQMWNEEYSEFKIRQYLESDERVTPDEVDFLMETVELAIEAYSKEEQTGKESSVQSVVSLNKIVTEQTDKEEEMEVMTEIAKPTGEVNEAELQQVPQPVPGKRGKRTGTTNTGTGTRKKLSLEEMIQQMESKIQLAKVFQDLPEIPFPENMSKSGRDLMLKFQKEYRELVEKYIGEIQEM